MLLLKKRKFTLLTANQIAGITSDCLCLFCFSFSFPFISLLLFLSYVFFFFLNAACLSLDASSNLPSFVFRYSSVSYMERTLEDYKSFAFIAIEMNLLPQLYQRYLASSETVTLALLSENYHRSFSHGLLMSSATITRLCKKNYAIPRLLLLLGCS